MLYKFKKVVTYKFGKTDLVLQYRYRGLKHIAIRFSFFLNFNWKFSKRSIAYLLYKENANLKRRTRKATTSYKLLHDFAKQLLRSCNIIDHNISDSSITKVDRQICQKQQTRQLSCSYTWIFAQYSNLLCFRLQMLLLL